MCITYASKHHNGTVYKITVTTTSSVRITRPLPTESEAILETFYLCQLKG